MAPFAKNLTWAFLIFDFLDKLDNEILSNTCSTSTFFNLSIKYIGNDEFINLKRSILKSSSMV